MFSLCIFLFLQSVYSYEVTTKLSSDEHSNIFDLPKNATLVINDTKPNENKAISMERITQPLQTQKIERTLESHLTSTALNSSLRASTQKESNLKHFKPSPQLETYYEYNKFPVEPALPEAKTFGNFHENSLSSWTEKPELLQWNKKNGPSSWLENPRGQNVWDSNHKLSVNSWVEATTTERPWVNRVRFPQSSYTSGNEEPYKFITNNDKLPNYPSNNFPVTTEGFLFNKPVETSNKNPKPTKGFWEKLMGYGDNVNKNPEPVQKTFYDYNLLEKSPQHSPHKEIEHGMSYGENPWKKIIKLLTTVIPIGLLISALTPTVITVTSVNDTQSRYRVEDSGRQDIVSRLASSLNYLDKLNGNGCEDKVLCELLVSASISKNSEEHVENLLNNFSEHADIQTKKEDLIKIFQAVKNEDCSSILCGNIKKPT